MGSSLSRRGWRSPKRTRQPARRSITTLKWYFLRWLTYAAEAVNGLLGVVSLGFWDSGVALRGITRFLDYAEKTGQPNEKGKYPDEENNDE